MPSILKPDTSRHKAVEQRQLTTVLVTLLLHRVDTYVSKESAVTHRIDRIYIATPYLLVTEIAASRLVVFTYDGADKIDALYNIVHGQ